MVRYMKCPRCELNYIDAEKQEYCDICLKEMKGIPTDADEIEEEESEQLTELCPICGENMMLAGEKMCEECKKKMEYEEEEPDPEQDDEWRNYLDDDTDVDLGDSGIDEAFDEDFDEEEEADEEYQGEDEEEDLEYVTGDEIYNLSDDDEDDDDEKKDEDDDF